MVNLATSYLFSRKHDSWKCSRKSIYIYICKIYISYTGGRRRPTSYTRCHRELYRVHIGSEYFYAVHNSVVEKFTTSKCIENNIYNHICR